MIAALTLCVTTQGVGCASGQPDFNNFYSDSTLRLDYISVARPVTNRQLYAPNRKRRHGLDGVRRSTACRWPEMAK